MHINLTQFSVLPLAVLIIFHIGKHCSGHNVQSLSSQERTLYKEKIKSMFYHAYDSYLTFASGYDELQPISCAGMNTWGTFSLSLIDALDTLAIMGNYSEFRRVAQHIIDTASFETNTNVSVFETNIRVIGGLLSAHLLAVKAGMEVEEGWPCSGPLLRLAENVARKLLPAFDTATGMPFGTVNFLHGVPENETPVTCTAGVGTFIVEFGTLSRLTGDPIFEQKAIAALDALQKVRSKIGLLGNHVNVQDGKWVATEAGLGAGVDSYYEYLAKGALLLQMPALMEVFQYDYELIKNFMKKNDWYVWVSMSSGSTTMPIFQSLEAFFPGILTLVGDIDQAKRSLYNYHQVWKQYGFVPEFYDIVNSKSHKRDGYPLRPEFIESVLYLYQATKDPHLLSIGADVVDSISHSARTECGYATIKSVLDHTLEDRMESFFLAETLKYLYLLFDENNFLHNKGGHGTVWKRRDAKGHEKFCILGAGGYVFNTEAHPVDIAALSCCHRKEEDNKLLAFEGVFNLIDNLLPLKKINYAFDELLKELPLSVDDAEKSSIPNDSITKQTKSSISNLASKSATSKGVAPHPIQSSISTPSDKTTEISQVQHENADSPLKHSAHASEIHTASREDSAVPLSPTTKPTQSRLNKEDFELPIGEPAFTNSTFDLTQYYDDLKQIAYQLEHGKEGIEMDTQSMERSSYELLFCPSQTFLARLSLQGQMFESYNADDSDVRDSL